jgi:hypothetical protein
MLPEEEINRFIAQGDQLWIPGADARGSWRWGNLYRRDGGSGRWWQQRQLPHFIHVHDLAWHHGQLVVVGNGADPSATGTVDQRTSSALALSSDAGQHWQVKRLKGWRATALLPVDGQLFAIEALPGPQLGQWLNRGHRLEGLTAVHQWQANGSWLERRDISRTALLPGLPGAEQRFVWLERATRAGQAVAWIARAGRWHQDPPRQVAFVAQRLRPGDTWIKPIPLQAGELAMDLQASGTGWLLLSSKQLSGVQWENRITHLDLHGDAIQRTTLLSFQAPLPAWALAGDRGRIFVGLAIPPSKLNQFLVIAATRIASVAGCSSLSTLDASHRQRPAGHH